MASLRCSYMQKNSYLIPIPWPTITHQFPENSFQSYISPPQQGSFSKTMNCYHDLRANFRFDQKWIYSIINSGFFVMYIIHIAVNNLWVYLPPKTAYLKCYRETLFRQPEETTNHSPIIQLVFEFHPKLNSLHWA